MNSASNNISENLTKLGIYELRNLARELGVKSPTTKLRAELIDSIKKIIIEGNLPEKHVSSGRPAKKMYNSNDLMNSFINSNINENEISEDFFKPMNDVKDLMFEQKIKEDSMNGDLIQVKGVMRENCNGTGLYLLDRLRIGSRIYAISTDYLTCRYGLQEGDLIEGFCRLGENKNIGILDSISKINNNDFNQLKPPKMGNYILPYKDIVGLDIKLKEGQTFLEEITDFDSFYKKLIDRYNTFDKNGYKFVVLATSVTIETKLKLDAIPNAIIISSMFDSSISESYEAIYDAINIVNTMYERGENVCLFVINVLALYEMLDYYFTEKGKKLILSHTPQTIQTIKTLSSLSKVNNINASVTVFGNYYADDKIKFENELGKLYKASVKI